MTMKIISAGGNGSSASSSVSSESAFGETAVAVNTPVIGSDAVYGIIDQLAVATAHNGGTATAANSLFSCQTSATTESTAYIRSDQPLTYHPGVGSMLRFTAMYTTGTASSWQLAGLSNVENFLQIGYRYSTGFGVHRGRAGALHVHKFTVTTGASSAATCTITLDGGAKADVSLTANNDVEQTAWEIAAADYSAVGDGGWKAYAEGAIVYFESERAEVHGGAFSFGADTTGAAVTVAEEQPGVAPTVTSVLQTAFNVDKLDGTGASGMTIDPTKLNVYQIQYQYLGAGAIDYSVENPETGRFILFHREQFANSATTTHVENPNMFFRMEAYNGSGTDDVTIKSASFGGFHQGHESQVGPRYGLSVTKAGIGTSFEPIVSIRGSVLYGGKVSFAEGHVESLSASVDGTKGAVIAVYRDATLNNLANFGAVDASSATVYDSSATTVTGGHDLIEIGAANATNVSLKDLDLVLGYHKDEVLTFAAKATSSTTGVTISLVMHEEV